MASVALGKHYEEFVRRQVESGRYSDASEVLREGLRLLEDHEAARERWLRDEIPGRLEQFRNDKSLAIPAADLSEELERRRAARRPGR